MIIDDATLDAFEDDIVRLSRRKYAEVGVPMFLVPEDLTRPDPPASTEEGSALAIEFEAMIAALTARSGPLTGNDLAHVLEVLADRHFLDVPFSSLSEDGT